MDIHKQRAAALSIAREMAREGMTRRQVRREITALDLDDHISPMEIVRIVSRHRPFWKFWFPFRYRIGRRLLGGSVALVCLIGLFSCVSSLLQNPAAESDPAARRMILHQQGDALEALFVLGIFLGAGVWLLARPDDGDDEILDDGGGLPWFVGWLR